MNPNERYYQDSGAVPFGGSLLATGLGLVCGILFGGLYGIVSKHNPYIILQLLALGVAVVAVGFAVNFAILQGKVRNQIFTTIVALVAGVTTVYFEWVGFLWAWVEYQFLPLNPDAVSGAISFLANAKIVEVFGWQPTATALYVIWGLEALVILFGVWALAANRDLPFCEECGEWADEFPDCATFVDSDHERLRRDLENERYDALEEISEWAGNEINLNDCLRATLYQCPCEGEENYLTLKHVVITVDGDGDESRDETEIVRRIWVPDSVVEMLLVPRDPVTRVEQLDEDEEVQEQGPAGLDDLFERA